MQFSAELATLEEDSPPSQLRKVSAEVAAEELLYLLVSQSTQQDAEEALYFLVPQDVVQEVAPARGVELARDTQEKGLGIGDSDSSHHQ